MLLTVQLRERLSSVMIYARGGGSSTGTVGVLAGRGFCDCTMWRRLCGQGSNRAHQLGRSQAGEHDHLPAVRTSRDDGLAREVVPSESHSRDL